MECHGLIVDKTISGADINSIVILKIIHSRVNDVWFESWLSRLNGRGTRRKFNY